MYVCVGRIAIGSEYGMLYAGGDVKSFGPIV